MAIEFGQSRLDGLMRCAASLDYNGGGIDPKTRWEMADKGEAAATENKVRGCAAKPSQTTCDD